MGKDIPFGARPSEPVMRARGIIQRHLGKDTAFILRPEGDKTENYVFVIHESHLPWKSFIGCDSSVSLHPRTGAGGIKLTGPLPGIVKSIQSVCSLRSESAPVSNP